MESTLNLTRLTPENLGGLQLENIVHKNHPAYDESVYSDFKLLKHTERLAELQKQGFTNAPVILDFDVTDMCGHKCPMCLYGETNTEKKFVSFPKAQEILRDASEMGSRAVTFAGGGEPTGHPHFQQIMLYARSKGLETAMFTHGQNLNDSLIGTIVDQCTWMRISLDADGPAIYKKTHGRDERVFGQVTANIGRITERARNVSSDIVVGISYLIGPQSIPGIYNAAKLARELGVQAIRFRPFFNFQDTRTSIDDLLEAKQRGGANIGDLLDEMQNQLDEAMKLKSPGFDVSYPGYRVDAMKGDKPRGFDVCYYPHFSASITADLKLYPCCPLKGYPEYEIGDLSKSSLKEVWPSAVRRNVHQKVDFKRCPNPCQFHGHALLLKDMMDSRAKEHRNFL